MPTAWRGVLAESQIVSGSCTFHRTKRLGRKEVLFRIIRVFFFLLYELLESLPPSLEISIPTLLKLTAGSRPFVFIHLSCNCVETGNLISLHAYTVVYNRYLKYVSPLKYGSVESNLNNN